MRRAIALAASLLLAGAAAGQSRTLGIEGADAPSWFRTDPEGRQLASSPPQPDILGENFAYRDYFHAEGEDYEEGTPASPIRDFHFSIAFRSKATEHLIVAFTTPIWDGEKSDRQVIGVLGMTVKLGSFAGLQTNLGDDQLVVLVETKQYRIDEEEGAGLVLHHPGLAESSGGRQIFRLDPAQIESLRMLTQLELGRRARLNRLTPEEKNAPGRLEPLIGAMETSYRDAVGGRFEGEWLAAFAPVIVNVGSDALDGSGWIVIVQERKD